MELYYDFHLHSCLSPCGDNDMTPYNIVNMAKLLGLDIIALTDHNTCQNCPAAIKAGENVGLNVVPGMELCTSEEAHVVCLFRELSGAMKFSDYVLSTVPPVKNRPDIFGEQYLMDEYDNIIGSQDILLTTASGISINNVADEIKKFGGVCYPAHIDRNSYSVISNLGMITQDMKFSAVEMTEDADREGYKKNYPILNSAKIFTSSDAHYLENMKEAAHIINLSECSSQAVVGYIKGLPEMV